MRSIFLILCFTCASIPAPRSRPETISGRIVAYSPPLTCLNGNGYWSALILVEQAKHLGSKFVRMDFSLPCEKSPDWISAKPAVQKFRLIRNKDGDVVLTGSVEWESEQSEAMPIWKRLPGAEHNTLPFGQVLPCYRSIDLPLTPVV